MAEALSQQDVDAVFNSLKTQNPDDQLSQKAELFDFRRPDRIAKSQLRAIHLLHDNFVRSLVSSLSAYLRTYLIVNLVSVEQLSFAEFLECLPSPTCLTSLNLRPYDGNAVLEINPSLIFPILEILLGGNGKASTSIQREITEIEQSLLDGLFRIILRDLKESWKPVTTIEFNIESVETEPQFLQILAPSEAVVAIAIEIRIGETIGMMNLAIPSIVIKMMRQKFSQQWSVRKSESTGDEQARILDLIRPSIMDMEVLLQGPTLSMKNMIELKEGDVLTFDYPVAKSLDLHVNGKLKFRGQIAAVGQKLGFNVEELSCAPAV